MVKKIFFAVILLFSIAHARVTQESLFGQTFIFKGPYDSIMLSNQKGAGIDGYVSQIDGAEQFSRDVFNNHRPVVVKVFNKNSSSKPSPAFESVYKEVSEEFSGKVDFVSIDISGDENMGIIVDLISQIGGGSFDLPFFLLFKQNELLVPPVVFPRVLGDPTKDLINRIKSDFIKHINNRFFLSKRSTWEKVGQLSEKVGRLLSCLQHVSEKELKACKISNK